MRGEISMHIVSGFQVRELFGETVAIPTGDAAKHLSGIISLNELGRFLFDRLAQEQTVQSLVAAVLEEYEVDEQTAKADVEEFLNHLRGANLLIE